MKDEADTVSPIIRALNRGLELPQAVAARLHEARQRALARQRSAAGALALPGGLSLDLGAWKPQRLVLPALLIVAIAFSGHQWMETQRQAEIHAAMVSSEAAQEAEIDAISGEAAQQAEIDAAMVSEELPLEAYLDRDFYVWLYTPPEQSSSF
jgi:hypothetical protein